MTDPRAVHTQIADILDRRRAALAEETVLRCWAARPDLEQRCGQSGRQKYIQEVALHLSYLSHTIAMSCPELFEDYLYWAKVRKVGLGVRVEDLADSLDALSHVLAQELTPEMEQGLRPYLAAGRDALARTSDRPACFEEAREALPELTRQYMDTLLQGDRQAASRLILDAVAAGTSVRDIYLHVFQQAQYEIGRLWQANQVSTAQEHLFTASTQIIMSQLYSHIFSSKKNGRTLVAACVGGDLHEIGCRMVADFFEMEGWDTFYYGANTPASSIVEAVQAHNADVLAISATMTFHVRAVVDLIVAVRAADPDRKVTIMVGGYPFKVDPDLWRQVGADSFARDAEEAVAIARRTSL